MTIPIHLYIIYSYIHIIFSFIITLHFQSVSIGFLARWVSMFKTDIMYIHWHQLTLYVQILLMISIIMKSSERSCLRKIAGFRVIRYCHIRRIFHYWPLNFFPWSLHWIWNHILCNIYKFPEICKPKLPRQVNI